jgi:O-acetyl-ADP-ribose deacetylase (regulator of RNase III)
MPLQNQDLTPSPSPPPNIEQLLRTELPFLLLLSGLFLGYGWLVRRGVFREKQVIYYGMLLGAITVGLSTAHFWRPGQPMVVQLINPLMMAICTAMCITMAQRTQKVEELLKTQHGTTAIIVRLCSPSQFPTDIGAIILPTSTLLRGITGPASQLAMVAGRDYENEVNRLGPVAVGQTIITGTYRLFSASSDSAEKFKEGACKIYHVATHEAKKNMTTEWLKRGVDSALQKAAKTGAKSVAIACGKFPGLTLEESTGAIVGAAGRHHAKFETIYFCAFDTLSATPIKSALKSIVTELGEEPA